MQKNPDKDLQPINLSELAAIHDLLAQWLVNASCYRFEGRRAAQAQDLIIDADASLRSALINLMVISD